MSYDLSVYMRKELSLAGLQEALEAAKSGATIMVDSSIDLALHQGQLPVRLAKGRASVTDSADWVALPIGELDATLLSRAPKSIGKALRSAMVAHSVSASGSDESLAVAWALSAAAASSGKGVVHDPQADETEFFTATAAWRQFKRLRAELHFPGSKLTEEQRLVSRLTRANASPNVIAQEVAWLRERQRTAWLEREYGGLTSSPQALAQRVTSPGIKAVDELTFLLDLAWRQSSEASARTVIAAAPLDLLAEHLLSASRAIGLSSERYLRFLIECQVATRLPAETREQLRGAASRDLRELLREAFERTP